MSSTTKISWTNATWNPLVGCSIKSPGCTHCYAMGMGWRQEHGFKTAHYQGTTKKVNGHPVWTGKVNVAPDHIFNKPLTWRKPVMCFVNSMSDLFHEDVPFDVVDRVFAIMALTPHVTYQVLTKRAGRMREYMIRNMDRPEYIGVAMAEFMERDDQPVCENWPFENVWLGVSAEDQKRADERIPLLLDTPAAVRWVSIEPQLGPIDAVPWMGGRAYKCDCEKEWHHTENNRLTFRGEEVMCVFCGKYAEIFPTLDWVVAGAESGHRRRPFNEDWARSLRDQCQSTNTPFFFKQTIRDGKKVETPELDGKQWLEYPR